VAPGIALDVVGHESFAFGVVAVVAVEAVPVGIVAAQRICETFCELDFLA
jgi:hypothetical protein